MSEDKNHYVRKADGTYRFVVVRPTSFNRTFETAAWSETIEVQPGEYPVSFVPNYPVKGRSDYPEGQYWAVTALPGRCVHEHFPNLFAGNPIGGGPSGPVDREDTFHLQTYAFMVTRDAREEAQS